MIAGSRPLGHLKLVQVEIVESVEAHERCAFDEAAIDEVLGLLEALGTDGVLVDLISEQVGLVEFDGLSSDGGPAATACHGQRVDEQLPGIVARLAAGHLPVHHDKLAIGALIHQVQGGRDCCARERKIQRQFGKVAY